MTTQEEFDWYGQQIYEKRKELDVARQKFFDIDHEVMRLERERARLFRFMLEQSSKRSAALSNGERE